MCTHLAKCFEGESSKDGNKKEEGKLLTVRATPLKICIRRHVLDLGLDFLSLRTKNQFLKFKGVSRTRFFRDPGYTSDLFQCWRMRRKGKNVCGGPVKVSPLKKQVSF